MKYLIVAATLLILSCNVNDEATDRINLQADSVLLTYDRVLVQRLDAQGNSVATLFDGRLDSLNELSALAVPGYHGGPATFSIKGYVGATLVYDVLIRYDGTTAAITIVKPVYNILLSIENPTDQDADGYYSLYDLKMDVNTNAVRDTVRLELEYYFNSNWQPWDSATVVISGNSPSDAYTFTAIPGNSQNLVDYRAQIYDQAGDLAGEEFLMGVPEETYAEDYRFTVAMSVVNPTDMDGDGYYSLYHIDVDVNTNASRDTVLIQLEYLNNSVTTWRFWDSATVVIAGSSAADARLFSDIPGDPYGLIDFRARIYDRAGNLAGEEILYGIQEETASEDFPGYEFYIINHTGTNLSVNLDADGQTDSVNIAPTDTVLAISTTFSPYILTYRALCTGNTVYWADTLFPGSEISDTVRLTLGPSFYVLETQNLSTSYIVDQIVIDSGTANEWVHNNWTIANDGIKYELGAYLASPSSTVIFRDRANSRSWRFSALSFQTNATYGYRYVTLNLY